LCNDTELTEVTDWYLKSYPNWVSVTACTEEEKKKDVKKTGHINYGIFKAKIPKINPVFFPSRNFPENGKGVC